MDDYSVNISGSDLDVDKVTAICSDLMVLSTRVRDERFYTRQGKRRDNVQGQKNHESSVSFDSLFC